MSQYLPVILVSVLLNAFAQLLLKKGMLSIEHFSFSFSNILSAVAMIAFNLFILLGFLCYALSISLWLLVLSRVDVSFAYPFLSVGFIVTTVIGYLAFNENLSGYRILGILVICLGVIFISKS
jgi:drug/metabolite transporter (DMT)-like permease